MLLRAVRFMLFAAASWCLAAVTCAGLGPIAGAWTSRIGHTIMLVEQFGGNIRFTMARLSSVSSVAGHERTLTITLRADGFEPFSHARASTVTSPFLTGRDVPGEAYSIALPAWFLCITLLAYPAIHWVVGSLRTPGKPRRVVGVRSGDEPTDSVRSERHGPLATLNVFLRWCATLSSSFLFCRPAASSMQDRGQKRGV